MNYDFRDVLWRPTTLVFDQFPLYNFTLHFFYSTYTFFRTTLPLSQYYSVRQLVPTKLVLRLFLFEIEVVTIAIRDFKIQRRDGNENVA